jgi:SAM-dependent methyltransferase
VTEPPAPPRRHAPATDRNRDPILAVLRKHLPAAGVVVEVACGSGQHAAYFSAALPDLRWIPTDPDPEALASTDAWCKEVANVEAAQRLDVITGPWPVAEADALFCANMIHIAPPEALPGLLRGAARILRPGAPLILYGPFRRNDAPTAPSNEDFDRSLRSRNPAWGLRSLELVIEEAAGLGLRHVVTEAMPANNLCVVFRHQRASSA